MQTNIKADNMPINDPNLVEDTNNIETEERMLANEVIFTLGNYEVKFWQLIVALILVPPLLSNARKTNNL